ncbi:transcription elongation factor GreA [Treponema sp.]|uniref:transcription elongation factor GreA n=1 Tax=Treponema sp. TaxID=166 RepID=UPI00298DC171|nr:transcription elongation factor GreA [Treponema sp.]MCQ2240522.1 transcription elongation factor GreA [Treponema sp.]
MSETLENSVREMLKAETWTRAGIANFTNSNLAELFSTLEQAHAESSENVIKEICDEHLIHSKDSIIALFFSGMIALRIGSVDTTSLTSLFEIFENNHKEALVEEVCNTILDKDPNNKLALRKMAELNKNDDSKVCEIYEKLIKLDFEDPELPRFLADYYAKQQNQEAAVSYYKKALLRYIAAKNLPMAKPVWSTLAKMRPEDIDFFLHTQRKIAKTISKEKSADLLQEIYQYYKDTAKWDTAIMLLKIILEIKSKDADARREITACYREKYASNAHVDDYIRSSNLSLSVRNVFEAINDFEKHIAFAAGHWVYHRTWGTGKIVKQQGDELVINFGAKTGTHTMTLKMAVECLQPLEKDHIWVYKKTVKKAELAERIKNDPEWALKTIIKSFNNSCDEKRIKAEIVPGILEASKWTSWHAKAQKELAKPIFGVNPNNINEYTVRDKEMTKQERLANEFKAEKEFFKRIDIMVRYLEENDDPTDEQFTEMFTYFAGYIKSATTVNEQTVASYLVVEEIKRRISAFENPASFTFAQLYADIEKPSEMYTKLKDSKNTHLKRAFLNEIKLLTKWDEEYIRLFPSVLDKGLLEEIVASDKKDKVVRLVQDCFNDYRTNRNAVTYFIAECLDDEWFKAAEIPEEKQLVTLVNIIATCFKEIENHVNTTENKKTIKAACTLLFARKVGDETKNVMLDYMLEGSTETMSRMYTIVNDVINLDPSYKAQLRNGILSKVPDFKFQEAETKQESSSALIVTAAKLEEKRALEEDIEKNQLPKIAAEVAEAKEKGDLKENAEYIEARKAQALLNQQLTKLKEELARATVFDPSTATNSYVSFGTTVTLQDNIENKEITYTILGPWESNFEEGIISYLSPLGNELLNMKAGENKKFTINDKQLDMTVKSIVIAK